MVWSQYAHFAQLPHLLGEGEQSVSHNTIVVGNQNMHFLTIGLKMMNLLHKYYYQIEEVFRTHRSRF